MSKVRVTVDEKVYSVSENVVREYDKLVKASESVDRVDVFKKAISLYAYLVRETGLGSRLYLEDENGNRKEVEMR